MVCDGLYFDWKALPTPLQDLRHVIVDLRILTSDGWSGGGGPGSHSQALLRLLTTFLRTGPSFSENQRVLPELKLESLIVNVVDYVGSNSFDSGAYHTSQRLWVWVRMIALTGVLYGRVGVLRFHAKNKQDEWVIEDKGDIANTTQEFLAMRLSLRDEVVATHPLEECPWLRGER
ncbi:hypothetical protein MMC11_003669 [Xylographa trunciseda]|nr:hypothetical protein [Xylographa trunciseda]